MPILPRLALRSPSDVAPYLSLLAQVRSRLESESAAASNEPVADRQVAVAGARKWLFRRMEELEALGDDGESALDETGTVLGLLMGDGVAGGGDGEVESRNCGRVDAPDSGVESWAFSNITVNIAEPTASKTGDDFEIGRQIWTAGVVLARILDAGLYHPITYSDHVLELGCGTGLTAIVAASVLPAPTRITATDFHETILATARTNAATNQINRVRFATLDWNNIPSGNLTHGVDCIIAADVVYDAFHAVLLPEVVRAIFLQSGVARGHVCIVNRIRDQFLDHVRDFETNMHAAGFEGGWTWADELLADKWRGERQRYRVYQFSWNSGAAARMG
ncbi:S-adenosyl-L-methionine-dependent methyltransferase [Geranomyces variabilis]|nr:S-adenosyl-L-methionine-dependent methyltransferase [Geranomyces variabilis]